MPGDQESNPVPIHGWTRKAAEMKEFFTKVRAALTVVIRQRNEPSKMRANL
jgi:hypothetical protein